ncbi:MAG TPA: class I SAM-dependent methyltransferase [Thermoanaerobaculia bacterium]|nr:class I SAM-dependent methyltransferase [Thermoanaerobaculia bacterium]
MDRALYPHHPDRWDDHLFRRHVLEHLRPGTRVLDLGAGAGSVPEMDFRGRGVTVYGVDPDPRVLTNPHLDEAAVAWGESLPHPDASFALVFADNVLEHLPDPAAVFREVARVLEPGGIFLAKTPNRRHYVALAARLTPHRFHQVFNRWRGRAEDDTFPTRYRANTPRALRTWSAAAGLVVRRIETFEGRPEYLRRWPAAYLLGWLYERAVNLVPGLAGFRVLLVATCEKPR